MVWVIAFMDSKEEFYREEIVNKDEEVIDYGKVLTFDSKEETEVWITDYTDSSAFDFYSKWISETDLENYEKEYKKC